MLLIAGDSFAAVGETYFLEKENVAGDDYELLFTAPHDNHWCEQIAREEGINYNCSAISGGDIQHTVTVAIHEMQRKKYTHCIFHLTSFDRVTVTSTTPKADALYKLNILETLSDPSEYTFKADDCSGGDNGLFNFHDDSTIYSPHDFMDFEDDHFLPRTINSFRMSDQILRLGALIGFCNKNQVKLCIKTIFGCPNMNELKDLFGEYDLFDMVGCEIPPNDMIGHYTIEQHNTIREMFNEQLPDFLRINSSIV